MTFSLDRSLARLFGGDFFPLIYDARKALHYGFIMAKCPFHSSSILRDRMLLSLHFAVQCANAILSCQGSNGICECFIC